MHESPSELNKLRRFPGFRLIRSMYLIPKKSHIIKNLIWRFKKIHKKPIDCPKEFIDLLNTDIGLKEIPEDFPWLNEPYPHQEIALRYLYTHGSAGLLLEPGLGKTFVVLNYIKLMDFQKSIIVCPKALLFVWEDEVREHRHDLKVHVVNSVSWDDALISANTRLNKWTKEFEKTGDKRARANMKSAERDVVNIPDKKAEDLRLCEEADIIVVNYEKVTPGLKFLQGLDAKFLAIDESLIKDMTTNRTKSVHKLGSKIPFRTIMSGTLINNGPLDVFSPLKLIEPALTGGAYGAFEHYYAQIAKTRDHRKFVVGVGREKTAEIRDTLATQSIVMTKEEWLDLPDKHFHRIQVDMTESQARLYDELSRNHICQIEDRYIEIENPLALACYLNQISNGFLYTYDTEYCDDLFADLRGDVEEKSVPRETVFIESGKKQALREVIESQLSSKKFILWYNMTAEYEQIVEVLDEMGVEHLSIRGGSKDTGGTVHTFNRSETCQVLVCQSQSVNYGITVLGTRPEETNDVIPDLDTSVYNHVFWSLAWSLERYLQQQDRSHRIGQTRDVHYWILSTRCPIEELVYERLDAKKSVSDSILIDCINKYC